jgi:hypothetical protein
MKKCDFYGDECGGIKKDLKELHSTHFYTWYIFYRDAREDGWAWNLP